MVLNLYNTLTRKKEPFTPLKKGRVSMYSCGPTVYHYAHIGNMRAFVFADILRRTLQAFGYRVRHVMNITDVGHLTDDAHDAGEDKIEQQASREGRTAHDVAAYYTGAFFDDLTELDVPIHKMKFPRATDHIAEQIAYIKAIEKKGFTYRTSDGIYFDTAKLPDYGILARLDLKKLKEGARVEVNKEKRNPTDFTLWKFSPQGSKRQQEWSSPWGVGFPGWHIECSAMSKKLLGTQFDIHTGGIDHIPVHHTNEIAQSEAATGKLPARFWLHSNFLVMGMGDEKMSKSVGNTMTLSSLIGANISPFAYRYLLLSAHYRKPLRFTPSALQGAIDTLEKLRTDFSVLPRGSMSISIPYRKKFMIALADDLNTPRALAVLWAVIRDKKLTPAIKRATLLDFDMVLGLGLTQLAKQKKEKVPKEILSLAVTREEARQAQDWARADQIRQHIADKGYEIDDTPAGPRVKRVS